MPPSPAMRCSPGRELRAENHKRGRSLESGFLSREKDDDLALFNEVQSREKDNFLLQSNDDFEDLFSTKLRYFTDYKLGMSIPARGESSDMLNVEGDKNDYDWLLTPPDTPLFRSLDDESHETRPTNLEQRGRPRSQPISISRSSTMDKSYRSSRGSASPNRLSPSPRSSYSTNQSRGGRPSSASHSSPPPNLRHSTPTRKVSPSPSPSKLSTTPPPRSSTPTPRRMSTGSSGSRVRPASPVKTGTRGNSASPKIRAWQSNIPGFSLEAPPNLRTSLGDRPASYVRGSSPARSGRQSMSPVASRSVSSSHSHYSVASSGDGDIDSLQSIPVSRSSDRSGPRSVSSGFQNKKAPGLSKKPTRVVSSSSAPKRSFDMAIRQMDHRKAPQNMFRPLLSSVPSSTFYTGKASAAHRSVISRNSSITTSSNTSSDQATSGLHDTEEIRQTQEKTASDADLPDELFVLDKADATNEEEQIHDSPSCSPVGMNILEDAAQMDVLKDAAQMNVLEDAVPCSKCGQWYYDAELTSSDLKLCLACRSSEIQLRGTENSLDTLTAIVENRSVDGFEPAGNSHNDSEKFSCGEQLSRINDFPGNTEIPEGAGISVLLSSSSGKGNIVRSRTLSATNINYDDLSYVRDAVNSLRSSTGYGSVSATSSVDLGSTSQAETRFQRQFSGRKLDSENSRKLQSSTSSLSGTSSHAIQTLSIATSSAEELSETTEEKLLHGEHTKTSNLCADGESDDNCRVTSMFVDPTISNFEESTSSMNGENLTNCLDNSETHPVEEHVSNSNSSGDKVEPAASLNQSSLDAISKLEVENGQVGPSPDSGSDACSSHSESSIDELNEQSLHAASGDNDEIVATVEQGDSVDHNDSIVEESTVMLEGQGGNKARSLTLEEATDTILFCSSIVHNLAYRAANIAIEKENSILMEASRPTVTILGKENNSDNRRNPLPGRRNSKSSQKARQKIVTDRNPPRSNANMESEEKNVKSTTRIVGAPIKGDSLNPPKLESKCNCTIM